MMHLYVTQAETCTWVPGAIVAVPERHCLTFAAELIPHLRTGTTLSLYIINPATGLDDHEWVFKCT